MTGCPAPFSVKFSITFLSKPIENLIRFGYPEFSRNAAPPRGIDSYYMEVHAI